MKEPSHCEIREYRYQGNLRTADSMKTMAVSIKYIPIYVGHSDYNSGCAVEF